MADNYIYDDKLFDEMEQFLSNHKFNMNSNKIVEYIVDYYVDEYDEWKYFKNHGRDEYYIWYFKFISIILKYDCLGQDDFNYIFYNLVNEENDDQYNIAYILFDNYDRYNDTFKKNLLNVQKEILKSKYMNETILRQILDKYLYEKNNFLSLSNIITKLNFFKMDMIKIFNDYELLFQLDYRTLIYYSDKQIEDNINRLNKKRNHYLRINNYDKKKLNNDVFIIENIIIFKNKNEYIKYIKKERDRYINALKIIGRFLIINFIL
jgi:hypothetical protein